MKCLDCKRELRSPWHRAEKQCPNPDCHSTQLVPVTGTLLRCQECSKEFTPWALSGFLAKVGEIRGFTKEIPEDLRLRWADHQAAGCPRCGGHFQLQRIPDAFKERQFGCTFRCRDCHGSFDYVELRDWWDFVDVLIAACNENQYKVPSLKESEPSFDLKRIAAGRYEYLRTVDAQRHENLGSKLYAGIARKMISLEHCEKLIDDWLRPKPCKALSMALEQALLMHVSDLYRLKRQEDESFWELELNSRVDRLMRTVGHWRKGGVHSPHPDAVFVETDDAEFFAAWCDGKMESTIEKRLRGLRREALGHVRASKRPALNPIPTFREFIEKTGPFAKRPSKKSPENGKLI